MKNYDEWNNQKKFINDSFVNKYYREREVWWCKLGINVGFEQDGTVNEFARPVLIIRGFSKNVCMITPLTTSKKNHKYFILIKGNNLKDPQIIITQLKLIDTKRLTKKICTLDINQFSGMRKTTRNLF